MAKIDWFFEAQSFGNCNYCCPCQFELLRHSGSGPVRNRPGGSM
jgi:hypothetical protein